MLEIRHPLPYQKDGIIYLTVRLRFLIERKETPFTVKVCVTEIVITPLHSKGVLPTDLRSYFPEEGQLITGLPNDIAYIAWIEREIFIVVTSTTSHGPYKSAGRHSNNTLQHHLGLTSAKISRFFIFQRR